MFSKIRLAPFAPIAMICCGLLVGCQSNSGVNKGELALAAAKIDVEQPSSKPVSNWQGNLDKVRAKQQALREKREEKRQARLQKLGYSGKTTDKSSLKRGFDRDESGSFFSSKSGLFGSKKVKVKSASDGKYGGMIARYAKEHGVPLRLARAVVQVESNFRANSTGAAGEVGLMQIKLSTARGMGYKGSKRSLYDPATNLYWGMKYLGRAHQLSGGTTCGTILKYNAGHGAKRMNKISSRYCGKVKRILT
ncbi:MAG: transglycosylase SLT domain-containing protein [Pseudomonadota bacterium]